MARICFESNKRITQKFGNGHEGIDIGYSLDESRNQVFSLTDGEVIQSVDGKGLNRGSTGTESYGNFVMIRHANGIESTYAHLQKGSVKVKIGDKVTEETKIGIIGESGNSYGRHLHLRIKKNGVIVDPTPYLTKDFNESKKNQTTKEEKIEYRVHIKGGGWLSWISKVDDTANGYAGIYGREIDGIQVRNRKYQAHTLNGKWWSEVSKVDDTANGYAGVLGRTMDGLRVHNAIYRVHLKNGSWLPWVSKVDNTSEGYAGIYGKAIDGVQIKTKG